MVLRPEAGEALVEDAVVRRPPSVHVPLQLGLEVLLEGLLHLPFELQVHARLVARLEQVCRARWDGEHYYVVGIQLHLHCVSQVRPEDVDEQQRLLRRRQTEPRAGGVHELRNPGTT